MTLRGAEFIFINPFHLISVWPALLASVILSFTWEKKKKSHTREVMSVKMWTCPRKDWRSFMEVKKCWMLSLFAVLSQEARRLISLSSVLQQGSVIYSMDAGRARVKSKDFCFLRCAPKAALLCSSQYPPVTDGEGQGCCFSLGIIESLMMEKTAKII